MGSLDVDSEGLYCKVCTMTMLPVKGLVLLACLRVILLKGIRLVVFLVHAPTTAAAVASMTVTPSFRTKFPFTGTQICTSV